MFTFIIGVQSVFLYYLSTITIPEQLQTDFNYANKQIISLKKEDGIIKKC